MASREIAAIRTRDDLRLAIELDGKAWIVLDALTAARLGLDEGRMVHPDVAIEAEAEAKRERALLRGASLVGRRSHARGELEQRLARRDGDDAARDAVDRLTELGAVDDERHAANLIEHRLLKGWGPARIEHDLTIAGVDEGLIRTLLAALDDEQLDAAARIALGGRNGVEGWQRLAARGFDESAAERLLGVPDAD
ncbi:MAG: regulatory protein RecX [Gaiellales bacterium]